MRKVGVTEVRRLAYANVANFAQAGFDLPMKANTTVHTLLLRTSPARLKPSLSLITK